MAIHYGTTVLNSTIIADPVLYVYSENRVLMCNVLVVLSTHRRLGIVRNRRHSGAWVFNNCCRYQQCVLIIYRNVIGSQYKQTDDGFVLIGTLSMQMQRFLIVLK
eukprot:COSAG02_NODE_14644_length_1251_cov_18.402778_3_plen_105_part_00